MKYQVDSGQIFITLARGDFINKSLEAVAVKEKLTSGWVHGLGAIDYCELGLYAFENQSYIKKEFLDEYELVNLTGNITLKDGNPFIHSHITIADRQFSAMGGHLFDGKISAAGEFVIVPGNIQITRKFDQNIGLALWCLGEKNA
ncbi:MAG: DNA-binding protein [Candidatus Marinimicrobia bacterium]|nr:DNA-binding protein [Candidatus Neomarinimicrobiota bacterium]